MERFGIWKSAEFSKSGKYLVSFPAVNLLRIKRELYTTKTRDGTKSGLIPWEKRANNSRPDQNTTKYIFLYRNMYLVVFWSGRELFALFSQGINPDFVPSLVLVVYSSLFILSKLTAGNETRYFPDLENSADFQIPNLSINSVVSVTMFNRRG
jgi:hypothetical protein